MLILVLKFDDDEQGHPIRKIHISAWTSLEACDVEDDWNLQRPSHPNQDI